MIADSIIVSFVWSSILYSFFLCVTIGGRSGIRTHASPARLGVSRRSSDLSLALSRALMARNALSLASLPLDYPALGFRVQGGVDDRGGILTRDLRNLH